MNPYGFDFNAVVGQCAQCGGNLTSDHRCPYGYGPKRDEEDLKGLQAAGRKAGEEMMKRVRLVSDFRDYYDHYCSSFGQEFRRISTEGPDRREMFSILAACGYRTPQCGIVRDFVRLALCMPGKLVIYLDETAHRGEGKTLLDVSSALTDCPDTFASKHIVNPTKQTHSIRVLRIGNAWFKILYESDDPWGSNCGNVETRVLDHGETRDYPINLPLYAVDFVEDSAGLSYAVDFNIAPGIRHSGVEDLMSGKEVVAKIEQAFADGCVNWSPSWRPTQIVL